MRYMGAYPGVGACPGHYSNAMYYYYTHVHDNNIIIVFDTSAVYIQ